MDTTWVAGALKELDAVRFEHLFGELLARHGWQTQVTQPTQDGGIDVYGWFPPSNPTIRVGFDTKRFDSGTLSSTDVSTLTEKLDPQYPMDRYCIVLTDETISGPVRHEAERQNVDIIGRRGLTDLLSALGDIVLCAQFRDGVPQSQNCTPEGLRSRFATLGLDSSLDACQAVLDGESVVANVFSTDEQIYAIERAAAADGLTTLTVESLTGLFQYRTQLAQFPPDLPTNVYWGGGASEDTPWAGKHDSDPLPIA